MGRLRDTDGLSGRRGPFELADHRGEQVVKFTDHRGHRAACCPRYIMGRPGWGGRQPIKGDGGLDYERGPHVRGPGQVLLRRGDVLAKQLGPVPPAPVLAPQPAPGQSLRPRRYDTHLADQAAIPRTGHACGGRDPPVPADISRRHRGCQPPCDDRERHRADVTPGTGELSGPLTDFSGEAADPIRGMLAVISLVEPENLRRCHGQSHIRGNRAAPAYGTPRSASSTDPPRQPQCVA